MQDLQNILALASEAEYDFRRFANPEDPLKHLFDEWVPYYRLKWAIARTLKPAKILEIGVRFGYSAAAFLDACPDADYLGIDNDSDTFGRQEGAIAWARRITSQPKAQYLIADPQNLDAFPGGRYDLIHINGQQDGAGSIQNLRKALWQAQQILVDGFFGTRDKFLNVSEFLYCYRDVIESIEVIPGYTGELLITPRRMSEEPRAVSTSGELKEAYTSSYYLMDCGGFNTYKRDSGFSLGDRRLRAVADLAESAPVGRALDLGCGRGELSTHLARLGHEVTAVDYSDSAIQLAQVAAQNAAAVAGRPLRIQFCCADVNDLDLSGFYDVVIASDVIEHLTPSELDRMYARIAHHLSPEGLFVVHTFPNAWYYKYEHARRLREARKVGAYLPQEPRSRYEQLMHINEQSPKALRRQLRSKFQHVLLWFSTHDVAAPFENLKRRFSKDEMRAAGDLFALASHAPIAPDRLRETLMMFPIPAPAQVNIEVLEMPSSTKAGTTFSARVRVTNNGPVNLRSRGPHPVHVSYHVFSETHQLVVFDGLRTTIPTVKLGSQEQIEIQLLAPTSEARYMFRVTIVQEYVRWFDESQDLFVDRWVSVVTR
jgi:2-polyprenyl-3-methyl-5-hydroxy-6-metoxy-1,4-benzoquinol methylase